MKNKQVLVFGSGAIGSLFGWKLQEAGLDVSIVARSDYKETLKNGISIDSIWGNVTFRPKNVFNVTDTINFSPDYIIVATKALPKLEIEKQIKPYLSAHTSIVLLQNGIQIEEKFKATYPNHSIISGLAFVCVTKTNSAYVKHIDYGRLVLGNYPKGIYADTKFLVESFKLVNVPCNASDQIQVDRWKKLIWNAPFNPISVVSGGLSTLEILETPNLYNQTKAIMKEVQLLAKSCGVNIEDAVIEKNIEDTKKMVPYKTSMLIDFEHNRPLEIDAILGNAIEIGKKNQVPTPNISDLYKNLKKLIEQATK